MFVHRAAAHRINQVGMTRIQRAIGVPLVGFGLVVPLWVASCGSDQTTGAGDAAATVGESGARLNGDGPTRGDDSGDAVDGGPGQPDSGTGCFASCPPGVVCGYFTDPCSGTTYACGTPCHSGQVCLAAAGDPTQQACQPSPCAGQCGVIGLDGCGAPINCGGCGGGLACVGNRCVTATSVDAGTIPCPPLSCAPSAQTALCGTIHDSCGNAKNCGSCPGSQQCDNGVCILPPPECSPPDGGTKCGQVTNACGSGTVECSACSGMTKCDKNQCVACNPPSCGGRTCGSVNNGCGPKVECGTCSDPGAVCGGDGGCCTPKTCAEMLADAGASKGCGDLFDLGCGVQTTCVTCNTDEACVNDTCVPCSKKTCADFDGGCGHPDNCGDRLDCCGAGLSCVGAICCPPNFVQYMGSCCLPSCDSKQPAGLQVSCGLVISCPD